MGFEVSFQVAKKLEVYSCCKRINIQKIQNKLWARRCNGSAGPAAASAPRHLKGRLIHLEPWCLLISDNLI
jgi:hypothetical protein